MQKLLDYIIEKRNDYINKLDDIYYESKVNLIDDFIVRFTQHDSYSYVKKCINNFYKWTVFNYVHEKDKNKQLYLQARIDLMYDLRDKFVELEKGDFKNE